MTQLVLNVEQVTTPGERSLGMSKWIDVRQADIDAFADVTHDWQYIHVDEEAAIQGPFGTTVAHGFLTLSLLSEMSFGVLPMIEGATSSLNYGFNRVRFIAPVKSGARVRGHFVLNRTERRNDGGLLLTVNVTVNIEHQETPALFAEWLIVVNIRN